jgi:hypothetical protein
MKYRKLIQEEGGWSFIGSSSQDRMMEMDGEMEEWKER